MTISISATKLVVGNVDAAERFYLAMGLQVISRNLGGEDEVRQEQSWLSATGDRSTHILILSRFVELPPPSPSVYPGEAWLAFTVSDVDATVETAEAAGGSIVRLGQDRPEHNVRAALVSDPEGHVIELLGPMNAG